MEYIYLCLSVILSVLIILATINFIKLIVAGGFLLLEFLDKLEEKLKNKIRKMKVE